MYFTPKFHEYRIRTLETLEVNMFVLFTKRGLSYLLQPINLPFKMSDLDDLPNM